jgi:hypothetical protein
MNKYYFEKLNIKNEKINFSFNNNSNNKKIKKQNIK